MEGILEGILKTTLNVSKSYINSENTLDYMQINKWMWEITAMLIL